MDCYNWTISFQLKCIYVVKIIFSKHHYLNIVKALLVVPIFLQRHNKLFLCILIPTPLSVPVK